MVYLHTKFRFSSFSCLENGFLSDHFGLMMATFLTFYLIVVTVHLDIKCNFSSSNSVESVFLCAPLWIKNGIFEYISEYFPNLLAFWDEM